MKPISTAILLLFMLLHAPALLSAEPNATRPQQLPPSTHPALDFTLLNGAPFEHWYSFFIDGKKVGFEHNRLSMSEGLLTLNSEVSFDFGEKGIQHYIAHVVARAAVWPEIVSVRFEAQDSLIADEAPAEKYGKKVWAVVASFDDAGKKKTERQSFPLPADLMHDYLAHHIALFMPREKGACLHYTCLAAGENMGPAAIHCTGSESIEINGVKTAVTAYDKYMSGQKATTRWIDARGVIVRNDYGTKTSSVLSTRDEALKDLSPKIKAPRKF